MKIGFNNKLESLYAIDYCVNRSQNIIKESTSGGQGFFDELYRIFLEKISDTVRDDAVLIGDYHRKAEYILNPDNPLPDLSVFDDFFEKNHDLTNRIIKEVEASETISNLHLDGLRSFFSIGDDYEINLILSMFINGAFGVAAANSSNIIVGVNYYPEFDQYRVADNITSKIYHDFAATFVQQYLQENHIHTPTSTNAHADTGVDYYLEELISRVLEIIFSSRIYGENYIETALAAQDRTNLAQVRIFLSVYLENSSSIYKLGDYIDKLIADGLVVKDE